MQGGPNHLQGYCNAPILTDFQELYFQPAYFYMGHFSKFVPPESVRVATSVQLGDAPPLSNLDIDSGVVIAPCSANAFQRWAINSDGTISLESPLLKSRYCLGANNETGALLGVAKCANQQWSFSDGILRNTACMTPLACLT